ncbi:MAG: DUF2721 domain-containing protein [Polymorphobacter sp.]
MPIPLPVESIAANIQLAVAPVFLLTGIGSILGVLAARIGRVVDRARRLEVEIVAVDARACPEKWREAQAELQVLDRRMASANWAIIMCTLAALCVCIVIAILFLGEVFPISASSVVAPLFIAGMALLITGLLFFLYEVQIALRSVRVKAALIRGDMA